MPKAVPKAVSVTFDNMAIVEWGIDRVVASKNRCFRGFHCNFRSLVGLYCM
jgi:hypothetical protein